MSLSLFCPSCYLVGWLVGYDNFTAKTASPKHNPELRNGKVTPRTDFPLRTHNNHGVVIHPRNAAVINNRAEQGYDNGGATQ